MSTWWRPIPDIPYAKLLDGCLEKYRITVELVEQATTSCHYLLGPDGSLQVHQENDGTCSFTRRGCVPWAIFDAIAEEFGIEWVSENDYRFWGFATEKEWDDWNEEGNKKAEDNFYKDLLHYVRDEPNDFQPGTIGIIKAEIAKTLVKGNLGLAAPEKRDLLLEAVDAIYSRDHAVFIKLTERELAEVDLMVARMSDLPKA